MRLFLIATSLIASATMSGCFCCCDPCGMSRPMDCYPPMLPTPSSYAVDHGMQAPWSRHACGPVGCAAPVDVCCPTTGCSDLGCDATTAVGCESPMVATYGSYGCDSCVSSPSYHGCVGSCRPRLLAGLWNFITTPLLRCSACSCCPPAATYSGASCTPALYTETVSSCPQCGSNGPHTSSEVWSTPATVTPQPAAPAPAPPVAMPEIEQMSWQQPAAHQRRW